MSVYDQRDRAVNIAVLLACAATIAAIMWAVKTVEVQRLRAAQMTYITQANQRHVEAEKLCAAVKDQEYIIRRESPLVRMSWTAGLKEICEAGK